MRNYFTVSKNCQKNPSYPSLHERVPVIESQKFRSIRSVFCKYCIFNLPSIPVITRHQLNLQPMSAPAFGVRMKKKFRFEHTMTGKFYHDVAHDPEKSTALAAN